MKKRGEEVRRSDCDCYNSFIEFNLKINAFSLY